MIGAVRAVGSTVRIDAATPDEQVECPGCATPSHRVHSRYRRRLSDTAISGREVVIALRIRRLFCDNSDCGRRTFAEQVPRLAARYARRTLLLEQVLRPVALALGGRAGARLTGQLAAQVGRTTLLRRIRALPDPKRTTPRVLGVDDFALRRGHRYGTILIDMNTRCPVDVLTDRSADTLTTWLRAHPGVEIVCRDRASAYAEGATKGAPKAIQVADRWHLWHNLGEAVERAVARHRACLSAAVEHPGEPLLPDIGEVAAGMRHRPVDPAQRRDRVAVRTRERYAQVHALLAEGETIRAIGIRLGLARNTARRFARAQSPEELLVNNGTGHRVGLLDEFKPYLHRRWNEGCTNATRLFEEIRARGYRGRGSMVRAYLQQFRVTAHIPAPPPKPPAARRVAAWIMTDPAVLAPDDQQRLDAILAASPELDSLAGHVRAFATMMTELKGKQLEQWMSCVDADDHCGSSVSGPTPDTSGPLESSTRPGISSVPPRMALSWPYRTMLRALQGSGEPQPALRHRPCQAVATASTAAPARTGSMSRQHRCHEGAGHADKRNVDARREPTRPWP
ncbi:ISL3 family transposase [Nocardia sp. BSTN01]|uniref:ISL3 family transposase n=1 Tax=Nocardia sp. BSTN01 TaxID=2783665 RepID=UPI0028158CF2|nr:ISL3 family transposase [Nocardia sp. BSTN01]